MKKNSVILLLFVLTTVVKAQFYVQPSIAFMFSSHPFEIKQTAIINNKQTVYTTSYKYGEGLNPGIILGSYLNDFVSIELNTCFHIFSRFSNSIKPIDINTIARVMNPELFKDTEYQVRILQIAPQIGYNFSGKKYSINLKAGPNYLKSDITHHIKYDKWDGSREFNFVEIEKRVFYYNGYNLGLRSSLGAEYQILEGVFGCVNFVLVYDQSKISIVEVQRYEVNGIDQIHNLPNEPDELHKVGDKINFSQVGISLGVKYVFQKTQNSKNP